MKQFLPDLKKVASQIAIYEYRLGEDRSFTYQQLDRSICFWIKKFESLNIGQGDFIALLSENRFEWISILYATMACGAVLVPLDSKATRNEWVKVLKDADPKLLICSETFFEEASAARAQLNSSLRLLSMDRLNWEREKKLFSAMEREFPNDPEATAFVIYTSGTTGEPKGVMVPYRALSFQLDRIIWKMNVHEADVFLSINPFNHLFELTCALLTSVKNADELVICSSLYPEDILRLLRQRKVTRMAVVPLFLKLMMNSMLHRARSLGETKEKVFHFLRRFALKLPFRRLRRRVHPVVKKVFGPNFREFVAGGAPLDPEVASFFESLGIAVYQGYGMTEAGPVITLNNRNHNQLGSVGQALPGSELKIVKKSASDTAGEIWVRGPHIMKGYYKKESLTNEVLVDGWLRTGDLGHLDENGFLYITGRNKDLIVLSGGKKVQPEEVEIALQRSPHFREVCVLGVPVEEGSMVGSIELMAVIVPQESLREKGPQDELEDLVRIEMEQQMGELAPYKRPSSLKIIWDELPKTSTRKVKRAEVLEQYFTQGRI